MRAASNSVLYSEGTKGACWIFIVWPQAQGSASTKWSGLVFTNGNLPLVTACFSQSNPRASGMERANVAQDWKHLLLRQHVPQSPTCQSPHWGQCWAQVAHREGKVRGLHVLVTNQNSSGRRSQWEIKFSTLNFPGGEGIYLGTLGFLSKSWHLRCCHLGSGSEMSDGGHPCLFWGAFQIQQIQCL